MIARDPEVAARSKYDLVVIGGGAYGVTLALEAARRGLRPLLLERRDFGGATSWNSQRIVHGGLRYLQSLDLIRFRESVAERRWWLRHFPDQVFPLACLMPLYDRGLRTPAVFRAALAANDALSFGRNRGVRSDRALPGGRVVSPGETVRLFPQVDQRSLRGGAVWHDGAMPDSQRLLIEMLHWATACGAVALNYFEALGLRTKGRRISEVLAADGTDRKAFEFKTRSVVNCAGPWCRQVAESFDRDVPHLFSPALAFCALLDRPSFSECALAVQPARSGSRSYFLYPWKGKTLAGTGHAEWSGPLSEGHIEPGLVQSFLEDLNEAVPGLALRPEDVLRVCWGFLPAIRAGASEPAVRDVIWEHGKSGGPHNLVSVSGVKFTTARHVAEKALRRVLHSLGEGLPPLSDHRRPPAVSCPSADEVETLVDQDPKRATEVVRRLVANESVVRLDDLVLRRTDWGIDPGRGRKLGSRIARLVGWGSDRFEKVISSPSGCEDLSSAEEFRR